MPEANKTTDQAFRLAWHCNWHLHSSEVWCHTQLTSRPLQIRPTCHLKMSGNPPPSDCPTNQKKPEQTPATNM